MGYGFHRNDARGTVIRVDPAAGVTPVDRVNPLVRAKSVEFGARTAFAPGLVSTVSVWALDLDSELVFVGDAVPAVWLAASTLFLLSTGMLWTNAAGGWYRTISATLGQGTPRESAAGAHRSALTGWSPPLKSGLPEKIDSLSSTRPGHEDHPMGGAVPDMGPGENALSLDRVIAIANTQQVTPPYAIALPMGTVGVYSVMSDRNQAFNRTYLHLEQYSGRILAHVRFKDFGRLAQFMLWAIIAHEGQLFGVVNQIVGTIAAAGVLLLGISGLMMWWQRRPEDRLFAPASHAPLPHVVFAGTIILGSLLPLLGASLVLGWLVERLVFRRAAIGT